MHFYISFFFLLLLNSSLYSQNSVALYCGTGTAGFVNGTPESSQFNGPFGICRTQSGDLLVADSDNHCIRRIDRNGNSYVFAGSTIAGYADGAVSSAQFNSPSNVCIDDSGIVYVADFLNHRIRKIKDGIVSTLAGNGNPGYADAPDTAAMFNYPRGIVIGKDGKLFVADSWNHRIREVDPESGFVSTYAGGGSNIGVGSSGALVNGNGSAVRFYTPSGLAADNIGNLYVADPFNHRIRFIDTSANVISFSGSGTTGPGNGGFENGSSSNTRFNTPTDLFLLKNGDLLVSDTYNNRIRMVSFTGMSSTFEGNGDTGLADGVDTLSTFNWPRGITADQDGDSIFIVDHNNHCIRLIYKSTPSTLPDHQIDYESINIFPVPAENKIVVQSGRNIEEAGIYDIRGIKFMKVRLAAGNTQIDISQIPVGVYLIKTVSNKNVLARFIKN